MILLKKVATMSYIILIYIGGFKLKALLEKLAWKKCHIATVNHKFKDATILDVADGFVLIETDEKEKSF